MKIKYTVSPLKENKFNTQVFNDRLFGSYRVRGEVEQDNRGTWTGWIVRFEEKRCEHRFNFKSRAAAARWVNRRLREMNLVDNN